MFTSQSTPIRSDDHFTTNRTSGAGKTPEDVRRRVQRLARSPSVMELHNSIFRLLQIERRIARAARRAKISTVRQNTAQLAATMEAVALARLPEYQQIAGALKALEASNGSGRRSATHSLRRPGWRYRYNSVASQFEADLRNLLRQLLDLRYTFPNRITLRDLQ